MTVLVIDLGGSWVKVWAPGHRKRRFRSGRHFTPDDLVDAVCDHVEGWAFDRIALGFPGVVNNNRVAKEPSNLGPGWQDFDFGEAFRMPLRMINDAAMQALGNFRGGRLLFLGLGTGLGSAMVIEGTVQPLELTKLPYKDGLAFGDFLGKRGLTRLGPDAWQQEVLSVIALFRRTLLPDEVVLGGGNARLIEPLPDRVRRGHNDDAFAGGCRLWGEEMTRRRARPALHAVMPDRRHRPRKSATG